MGGTPPQAHHAPRDSSNLKSLGPLYPASTAPSLGTAEIYFLLHFCRFIKIDKTNLKQTKKPHKSYGEHLMSKSYQQPHEWARTCRPQSRSSSHVSADRANASTADSGTPTPEPVKRETNHSWIPGPWKQWVIRLKHQSFGSNFVSNNK